MKLLIFILSYSLCPTSPTDNKKPAEARLNAGFKGFYCCLLLSVAASLAERVGFEPTVPCGTPDFESGQVSLNNGRCVPVTGSNFGEICQFLARYSILLLLIFRAVL